MEYTLEIGPHGVDTLTAPYALLVEAFGNDGVNPRDDYKSMCQWDNRAEGYSPDRSWEVYDYKVGVCYDFEDGLRREQITTWHVQAGKTGLEVLRTMLDAAVARLSAPEAPELPVGESEYLEVVDEASPVCIHCHAPVAWRGVQGSLMHGLWERSDGVTCAVRGGHAVDFATAEQEKEAEIRALDEIKACLLEGHSVNVGERDFDGLFVLGGVSVTMSHGVRVAVGLGENQAEELSAPMSEVEAREMYRALGVYLDLLDDQRSS